MTIFRWVAPALLGLVFTVACRAAELEWQSFETLSSGDVLYAQSSLDGEFGDDPTLWPDWIDPRAVVVPTGRGDGTLLVVRRPLRLACGEYGYSIFGVVGPRGGRDKLGEDFCAGAVEFLGVSGQALPDLQFHDPDRRVRWLGTGWGDVK